MPRKHPRPAAKKRLAKLKMRTDDRQKRERKADQDFAYPGLGEGMLLAMFATSVLRRGHRR